VAEGLALRIPSCYCGIEMRYSSHPDTYFMRTGQLWELGQVATESGRRMVLKRSTAEIPGGLSVSTAWLGALGLSCLSLACARTSDERAVAIARLLDEARAFQAQQYAPESFARAEDLLSQARAELAAQRDRTWFSSRRRRLRELLSQSEAAASLLRAEATAAIVRARQEAARELLLAHAALDQASEAYWRSPRGKDTRSDLERMRADLDDLLRRSNEAELALDRGDYLIAGRLAADVAGRAAAIADTIDRATAWRVSGLRSRDASDPPSRAPVERPLRASSRPPAEAPAGRRAG